MPEVNYLAIGWPALIAVLSLGYLLGSIPFGLVLTRLAGLGDLAVRLIAKDGTISVPRTPGLV